MNYNYKNIFFIIGFFICSCSAPLTDIRSDNTPKPLVPDVSPDPTTSLSGVIKPTEIYNISVFTVENSDKQQNQEFREIQSIKSSVDGHFQLENFPVGMPLKIKGKSTSSTWCGVCADRAYKVFSENITLNENNNSYTFESTVEKCPKPFFAVGWSKLSKEQQNKLSNKERHELSYVCIHGQVFDENNQPLNDVQITLASISDPTISVKKMVTEGNSFSFNKTQIDVHFSLRASKEGYNSDSHFITDILLPTNPDFNKENQYTFILRKNN